MFSVCLQGVSRLPGFQKFEKYPAIPLRDIFRAAGQDNLDLLAKMLAYDPNKRLTATQVCSKAWSGLR
jgi:cyclin-dependent kinase 7